MKITLQTITFLALTFTIVFGLRAQNYVISTYAGTGNNNYGGDGGLAIDADLFRPNGITFDNDGNIVFSDQNNDCIRKIDVTTNIITTIAGTGTSGFSGDGGLATDAELNKPTDIAIDSVGNMYIADNGNWRVRKVDHITGNITTVVGNGNNGQAGFVIGGLAINAGIGNISGIVLDENNHLFISQKFFMYVLVFDVLTDSIKPAVGNWTGYYGDDGGNALNANIYYPEGLSFDNQGDLYIADRNNNRIRKVGFSTDSIITTVAGGGGQGFSGDGDSAINAELFEPIGLTVDNQGNIFIADLKNNRIRMVDHNTGFIHTIAGDGTSGYSGDGGLAIDAALYFPSAILVDDSTNLYVSDRFNHVIRKLRPLPNIYFSQDDTVICAKNSVQFSNLSSSFAPATYEWLFPGGFPSTSNQEQPTAVYYGSPGTYTISLIATNLNGTDTLTQTIEVHALPDVDIHGNTSFCEGISEIFTASSNVNPTYQWSNGDSTYFTIISTSGDYSVLLTDSIGCTNSDTIHVIANPLPIIYVSGNGVILPGDADTLQVSGADTYEWSTGSVYDTTIVSPNITTTYTVVGTDANGCKDAALFIVEVDSTLNIEDLSQNKEVIMYPNPATQKVYFEFNGGLSLARTTLRIIDMTGKIVREKDVNDLNETSISMDIQMLKKGIYVVKIISNKYTKELRLIKQ